MLEQRVPNLPLIIRLASLQDDQALLIFVHIGAPDAPLGPPLPAERQQYASCTGSEANFSVWLNSDFNIKCHYIFKMRLVLRYKLEMERMLGIRLEVLPAAELGMEHVGEPFSSFLCKRLAKKKGKGNCIY